MNSKPLKLPYSHFGKLIYLSLGISICLLACKKEPLPTPNQQPGEFTVNVTPNLNAAIINWTESVDPDDDPVTYTVIVAAETLATDNSSLSYTLEDLDFDEEYNGKIIAQDDGGLSRTVEFSFRTEALPNDPPQAFSLLYPPQDSQNLELDPILQWAVSTDPDGDVISYDIYLDQSATPSTLRSEGISDTQLQVSDLEEETTYYWKVVAKDGKGGEISSETFLFRTRASVIANLQSTAPWSARAGHTVLNFNGKMWVIGGDSGNGGRFNDVWSTSDGVNWTEEVNSAPWEARTVHSSVVFDNKMWVYGGNKSYSQGQELGDLWYSSDGVNWTEAMINSSDPFPARYGHEMIVYDDKMWIFGGRDVNINFSRRQVWNSADGFTWNLVSDDNGVNFSSNGEILVFDNKMWMVGRGFSDDTRYSTDGVNWTMVNPMVPFGDRKQHSTAVHNGRIWLMSGSVESNPLVELGDVWYSDDGDTWIRAAENAGFDPVAQSRAISFNNKLWLVGGGGGFQSFFVTNKVFSID
ncbi:MAG: hypothetical protein AAF927_09635 [Bacteroidota bacterium]